MGERPIYGKLRFESYAGNIPGVPPFICKIIIILIASVLKLMLKPSENLWVKLIVIEDMIAMVTPGRKLKR